MQVLTRRRFLKITASALAVSSLPISAFASEPLQRWQGIVLGTEGSILLAETDKNKAKQVFSKCLDEILRLEKIFSIYDASSSLRKLNQNGKLKSPDADFIKLLEKAKEIHEITEGAFDLSIQPLWQLYYETKGKPDQKSLSQALSLVDFNNVEFSEREVSFRKKDMALTFNGIAQGYITDKVSELLKAEGYKNVLVELGETRAIGNHPSARPWKIALKDPNQNDEAYKVIDLSNKSLATSGAYGMQLGEKVHHILDPRSGLSPAYYSSLSVLSQDATTADALSTGLSCLPPKKVSKVSRELDVEVVSF